MSYQVESCIGASSSHILFTGYIFTIMSQETTNKCPNKAGKNASLISMAIIYCFKIVSLHNFECYIDRRCLIMKCRVQADRHKTLKQRSAMMCRQAPSCGRMSRRFQLTSRQCGNPTVLSTSLTVQQISSVSDAHCIQHRQGQILHLKHTQMNYW